MARHSQIVAALLVALTAAACFAAEKRKAAASEASAAGADVRDQGEYLGTLQDGDQKIPLAAQVVALGGGAFRGVAYFGGLPGAGWNGATPVESDGQRVADGNSAVVFHAPEGRTATLKNGAITIVDASGVPVGELKKVERTSPTLGEKPPAGAIVLFDGVSADAFNGGQMTKDGLLREGCTSKQAFGDLRLHLEFRTPFVPEARGQARGNSGVYLQDRYEVQVLDSFGLEGKDNECGGIYKIAAPKVNACLPPLSWQTYDIDFTAARYEDGKKVQNAKITVLQNGIEIHKDLELPDATPGQQGEAPSPGPLYLQDHGNPVRFRNIWVIKK